MRSQGVATARERLPRRGLHPKSPTWKRGCRLNARSNHHLNPANPPDGAIMFVITLRFADKTKAPQFMDGHNAWIKRGFDDGVFLLVGSLQPNAGGAILAHNASPE